MTETELLKEYRDTRSEVAFAHLVRRYAGMVYTVAMRRTTNPSQAEDITQLVFIRFATAPPQLKNSGELAAWLHRTAVNIAIDHWRSESRRRNRELHARIMEPADHAPAVWDEIAPHLDEALNQLGDNDRQAVLLRYFSKKSMRDVGNALGVSEQAAKMRISRALDRLRTQLAQRGTACTTVAVGAMLLEHAVEAVPSSVLANLARLKVPKATGSAGVLRLATALSRVPKSQLVTGLVMIVFLAAGFVQFVEPRHSSPALQASQTQTAGSTIGESLPRSGDNGLESRSPSGSGAVNPTKVVLHILDSETGVGLANAKVRAAFFGLGSAGVSQELITDSHGDAAIPEPNEAEMNTPPNVFVSLEGYVPRVVNFSQLGSMPSEYTMKLDPALTVSGWVVEESGDPVVGAKVMINGPGNIEGQAENLDFQTCEVTTREDGSWKLSYIPKDWTNEFRILLQKPGYAATEVPVPVPQVDLDNLMLVIERGFTITGRAINEQNQPVSNAEIKLLTSRKGQQSAKSDDNGEFSLTGVTGKADTYRGQLLATNDFGTVVIRGFIGEGSLYTEVVIRGEGYAPQTRLVNLFSATNHLEFTLLPGNEFFGQVVDEAGRPVANAVVQTDWDNRGLRAFEWKTRTDERGRFAWDSAPAGEALFWIEAPGYQTKRMQPLEPDPVGHTIVLHR